MPVEFRIDIRQCLLRIAALWLLLVPLGAAGADIALDGSWRLAAPRETAADVRVDDPALQAFDPSRPTHLASADETAWIVLRPGFAPSEALAHEIQEFVKVQLAAHEYPRFVQFAETLPMTATGKVLRRELRALG